MPKKKGRISMDNLAFGIKLRTARQNKGMTRDELAEKVGITGSAIAHIERGNKSTSLRVMVKFCEILDISPQYLLSKEFDQTLKNLNSPQEELFQNILKLSDGEVKRFSDYIKITLEHQEEYKD